MTEAADPRRRSLLQALAVWPLSLASAPAWAQAAAEREGLVAPNVCLLTPETTAGPFYFNPRLLRADITEGRPGVPLEVVLQVVDADCRPFAGARVDVWQCDAAGNYSGYAQPTGRDTRGETFLRGTQTTDAEGVVRFRSIWPGWYPGRTPHIHYLVVLERDLVLTSQLFFPDGISEQLYQTAAAYRGRQGFAPSNAEDGIARRAGPGAFAAVTRAGAGLRAALVVGVDAPA